MRIGLDASSLPATMAGAGKYVCGLIRALAQIDAQNEYVLFVKDGTQNVFGALPDNFQFFRLPNFSRPARLLWQHCAAGFAGRRFQLDIWHGLHYSLPSFPGPRRTVSTFHDVAFFLYPQLYPAVKRFYFQRVIRRAWQTADAIIAVSRATANEARQLFSGKFHLDQRRLHVVHSGLEAGFFTAVSPEHFERVRARYALRTPYILFVGTLEKRKNLPLLIAAFQRLRERGHRHLLLVVAGQPSNGQPEIAKALAQENLSDAVRCLGYVPDADLLPLYQGAQLFVLPSVHEGFGFPLLEAMASGVPVLAADNSALRELAADHDMLCSGDAAAWANKIATLLFDQDWREKSIAAGRRHAQEFSWQQTAWSTLQVYESVCAAKPRGSRWKTAAPMFPRNGAAPLAENFAALNSPSDAAIRDAVLKTLAYADLFDYPLRLEEIHQGLLACNASLEEVKQALQDWQQCGVIEQSQRLFFVRGRRALVARREQRRQHTRQLLQKHGWLLRLVMQFPFVRSVSLSGAAAFENCKPADDIDLFVITSPRRLWSVYAALAVLLKLLGKRQVICLNCLLDLEHLRIAEQDFFVAHQIAFLRSLSGHEQLQKFQAVNPWVYAHLPQRRGVPGEAAGQPRNSRIKSVVEKIWTWRFFDYIERVIFSLYRRRIQNQTAHLRGEAVVVQPGQIKLFTHNHRHRLTDALPRRVQEILRHEFLPQEVEESYVAL